MGVENNGNSFVLNFVAGDNIKQYLDSLVAQAAKGITLGINMESDAGKVLADIEKISKALQTEIGSKNFDMEKLLNLNNAIAALGRFTDTAKGLPEIFGILTSNVTSLNGAISEIASTKLDGHQFSSFQNALSSINANVEAIAKKLNAVDKTSGLKSVNQDAKNAAEGIKKATIATEELENKQKELANANTTPAKTTGENKNTKIGTFEITEESLKRIIDLFQQMETHLASIKSVFTDVGDGGEFSPLLSAIDKINLSIKELNTNAKNIGFNMNVSADSASQLDRDFEEKAAKALIAYQRLFDHIKMSGAGGAINDEFFKFDLNAFDSTFSKVKALYNFIEKARRDVQNLYNGKDVLKQQTDAKYWTAASASLRQLTKIENQMNTAANTSGLENLFGKTDLTEVVTQLGLIATKLDEISATALEFKNSFKEGLNFNSYLKGIDDITNKIKGLEVELTKMRLTGGGASTGATQISSEGGQLALESTLKSTLEVQTKISYILDDINSKMSAGAEKAIPIYDKLHASIADVVTAIQSMNTVEGASAQTIDVTNTRIQELEAKLESVTQKYAALEERMKNAKSSKNTDSATNAVTQKTEEQIAIEQKVAEITKLSAESRIRIQENLQKQITKTVSLISTEYDKIREMYQYINDFAYQTNGKKDAFNKAMEAKHNLTAFNKSGSDDAIERAKLEYTYQRFYDDLLNRIGKTQSHNDTKMLSQLGNVKTSATMAENEAIIKREIELTAELIQKNKELVAAKQSQGESNKAALTRINEIEILSKQYDSYIAKKKAVDDLQNKKKDLIDNSAEEQAITNVNRQLDIALEKLAKAEAFIKQAAANDPVGAAVVGIKELNAELDKTNKLTSGSATKSNYNSISKTLRDAGRRGELIDTKEGQKIQQLITKFAEYDRWIAQVGGHFDQLSNEQQKEIQESIDKFNQLTAAQKDALKAGAYNTYNKSGAHKGEYVPLNQSQIDMLKAAQVGTEQYKQALIDVAYSATGYEAVSARLDNTGKNLIYTYHDQDKNLKEITVSYNNATNEARKFQNSVQQHQGIVKSVFAPFGNKLKEIFRYFSAYTIVMRFFNAFKQGVQYVRELNTALTEMQLVTESTADEMARTEKEIQKIAASVASTNTDIAKSATDWARLGYSMSDALELAGVSAQYAKVGFTDVATASENLTATMQGFYSKELASGLIDAGELAETLTDKFVDVGNKFASSADGLGQGMTAASAALVAAGNDVDEAIAMITAGTTVLQDEMETANAIKVLSMRLRGTSSKELEDAGEDTDGLLEDASKLQATIKKLTAVNGKEGVSIVNTDTGAYKSTYEILLEISEVWNELTDANKAALLEKIAGKVRANAAAAILSNGDLLEDAYKASTEAAGATAEAMEVTMTSIEARVSLFNQSVQTMWQNEMSSDFIKGFVDLGTAIVKVIDKIGLLSTALAGIAGYFGAKGQGRHTKQRVLIKYA